MWRVRDDENIKSGGDTVIVLKVPARQCVRSEVLIIRVAAKNVFGMALRISSRWAQYESAVRYRAACFSIKQNGNGNCCRGECI